VQNGGGASLDPGAPRLITQTLTFVSGNITNTPTSVLTIDPGGSIVGASNSGHVVGTLEKTVPAGSPTVTFEIGDGTNYLPVTTAFAGSPGGTLSARTDAGDLTVPAGSDLDYSKSVNRNWTLTAGTLGAFTSCTGTFRFAAGDVDGGANTANFVVRKLDGGTWAATTPVAQNATDTQASWTTGFSQFAIGELSAPLRVREPVATQFALSRVMPNPTRGAMSARFALPVSGPVRVSVVDLAGREVALLASGSYPAGWHPLSWNGATARGKAAAGVYFVRYLAGGKRIVERFSLLR
jgi:hypothetical protein